MDDNQNQPTGKKHGGTKTQRSCPLKNFSIGNFKAFGSEQTVPLKPITLIFGANSSGKSSILHSLILAHHALNSGDLNAHRTTIGGDSVDLGGFHQYVHKRNTDNEVLLSFNFRPPSQFNFRSDLLKSFDEFQIELRLGFNPATLTPRIAGYNVKVGGDELFRMLASPEGEMRIQLWETEHPVSHQFFEACLEMTPKRQADQDAKNAFREGIYEVLDTVRIGTEALPPYELVLDRDLRNNLAHAGGSPAKMILENREGTKPAISRVIDLFYISTLEKMLHDLHDLFSESVGQLDYLGPLRKLPKRHLDDEEISSADHANGAFAWKAVMEDNSVRDKVNQWLGDADRMQTPYRLEVRHFVSGSEIEKSLTHLLEEKFYELVFDWVSNPGSLGEYYVETLLQNEEGIDCKDYLQENPELLMEFAEIYVEDFNASLTGQDEVTPITTGDACEILLANAGSVDGLSIPDMVHSSDELSPVGLDLRKIALHWVRSDPYFSSIASSMASPDIDAALFTKQIIKDDLDRRAELSIIELRNQTVLSHRDIGVGISQILPVLVHAYASKNQIVAIEQPEIHIHPKLQAELGDVFIESALGKNGNTFLLETHSEHLILRIMKRIRQTADNELPAGAVPIHRDDVSILFVEPHEGQSIVREMPLTERGELAKAWPGGFFEEGLNELF